MSVAGIVCGMPVTMEELEIVAARGWQAPEEAPLVHDQRAETLAGPRHRATK